MTQPGGPSGSVTDPSSRRLFLLQTVVIALLLTLFGRLWYLQVASGASLAAKATSSRNRQVITPALRGRILDDTGAILVDNQPALIVTLSRTTLDGQSAKVRTAVLNRLGALLTISANQLSRLVEPCTKDNPAPLCNPGSPYQPVAVATLPLSGPNKTSAFVVQYIQETIKEHQEDYPGVVVTSQAVRTYPVFGAVPGTTLAAQTLGHIGPISSTDLQQGGTVNGVKQSAGPYASEASLLSTTDSGKPAPKQVDVGRGGLEQQYDAELRGLDADQTLTVDKAGDVDGVAKTAPAVQGSDLVLNIDDGVQQAAEQALQDGLAHSLSMGQQYGAADAGAAAVVMTPDDRIVALASTPSFDESAFESTQTYNGLLDNPQTPLNNRATTGIYAPGSSFKPITASAMLANNILQPDVRYDCPQTTAIGNSTVHNFESANPGGGDVQFMLQVSCDTIFAHYAAREWQSDGGYRDTSALQEVPDHEYLTKMAKAFGFGGFTDSDLPEASQGIVVDRATQTAIFKANKAFYCRDAKTHPVGSFLRQLDEEDCQSGGLYNEGAAAQFAIGQGSNLEVTPLQMARAYAAIANGGTLYAPTVGKALLRPDGSLLQNLEPKKQTAVPVSKALLSYVQGGMFDVTHNKGGTAAGVFGHYPVPVCGKTGTAEQETVNDQGVITGSTDTSWFGSFAPCSTDGSQTPKYIVMVVLPKTNQGALIAAPVAREIYDKVFGVVNDPPANAESNDGKGLAPPTRPNGPYSANLPCYQATGVVKPPNGSCAHPQAAPLAQTQAATTVVPVPTGSGVPLPQSTVPIVTPPADLPSKTSPSKTSSAVSP